MILILPIIIALLGMYFLIHPYRWIMMREWPYNVSNWDILGCRGKEFFSLSLLELSISTLAGHW